MVFCPMIPQLRTVFNRVLKFLDKDIFGNCLYRWSKEILSTLNEQCTHIGIDGKVLRATAKSGSKKSGLCLLTAWASDHELVFGQQKVDTKSNEKTAVRELLNSLDLKNSIVTIDAIACELKNADLIVSKQGYYILALKKNNKHIYQQVSERFAQIKPQLIKNEHIDFGSGRIETRFYLSDLAREPKDFNTYIRNHWSIENKLHCTGDPVEIRCRL
ncbi:ISAs1 family transposase [Emticicia sp.]|uniref:ISAs1 family transposase n=1 Tax=Emticicia sp. TaxID=1930953 RepID=UPI00375041E2